MTETAVEVMVPVDLMRQIEEALEKCSQDLAIELEDRYPPESRDIYPTYQRRWKNDMEPVFAAQDALHHLRTLRWWGHVNG